MLNRRYFADMYEVFVQTHFSAAHYLRNYPGQCEHLHGHNWNVIAVVRAKELNEIDVGIDFRDLKKALAKVLDELDHTNLNDHPDFQERNPSSELLAKYIYEKFKGELAQFEGVEVARITVGETPQTGVSYMED